MSFEALKTRLQDIHNLNMAGGLLGWDQRTKMPPQGAAPRAEQLATLSKISHEMLTSDETARLLEAAAQELTGADYDSDEASLVRVAKRDYEQAIKIPTEVIVEFERLRSLANQTWVEARATNDFSKFAGDLEKIFAITARVAEHLGYKEHPYDALIDQYEEGMTTAETKRIFSELRGELVPLVKAIAQNQDKVSDAVLHQQFDTRKQQDFGEMVVAKYGFNFQAGRQDETVHPFCSHSSRHDVRITTRFHDDWLSPALFGTMHEAGHGMYEQGIGGNLDNNILAGGTSLGVHESQSRLWENIVGRSHGFWEHFYPQLQTYFPDQLGKVGLEAFYQAVNHSKPSFIRVEADEVTYNLHIMVRFELETAVYEGKLAVKDLPKAWNEKYEEYLGVVPSSNTVGVLQDIHWSMGIMGYFPTYSFGNLLSVQFYNLAVADHPQIPDEIRQGKFDTLLNWMRQKIHVHGRKYQSAELVKRITGTSIQVKPYMDYLRAKYTGIYGL